MIKRLLATRVPLLGGIVTAAILIVAILLAGPNLDRAVEPARDIVLRLASFVMEKPAAPVRVVVVDIDGGSLDRIGGWPWPRETLARLIEVIARARPAVVAIDILFETPDTHSPAALARQLGARLDRRDLTELAANLPDGDKRLRDALASTSGILGFVLDPSTRGRIPPPPIISRGAVQLDGIWRGVGVVGPPLELAAEARGLGALALLPDASGIVRRVPLLVAADGRPYPGLALEALRVLVRASTYIIDGASGTIQAGPLHVPLSHDAMLRLSPVAAKDRKVMTVAAADLLSDKYDGATLEGAVVLIGGSAPELGGLRATSLNPATPSVFIQADAVVQLLRGYAPRRPVFASAIELATLVLVALAASVAAFWLRPLAAAVCVAAMTALIWLVAVVLAARPGVLIDPLLPTLMTLAVFGVVLTLNFAITQQREARVRQRFAQHLAPQVVSLIVADPTLVKLTGERREITALFTDIEGFTTMTDRLGPQELVSILDRYFEGVAAIVMKHGGMIDKLVGDAVHAFFNAPLDQSEHWRHAIDCGVEIRDWTEAFRSRPENRAAAMGRTRVGIETGDAVVGDVGIAAKLDYTAHGNAINIAARLEAANKTLGSSICIGATAAARYGIGKLVPLGKVALRGLNVDMDVYTPRA